MADEEQQGPPPPPAVGAESAGEWSGRARICAARRNTGGCAPAGRVALGFSEQFLIERVRRKNAGGACRSKGQRRRRSGACVWTQRYLRARPCAVVAPSGGPCCSFAPSHLCAASLLHPHSKCVEWCAHGVPWPTGGGGLGSVLQSPRGTRLLAMRLGVEALLLSQRTT